MQILFLDTETTDLNPGRRLVQLAYKNSETGVVVNEYFKPPVPISYGSMAVHHITNEMVADKPVFSETTHFATLAELLPSSVIVAHNAPFDIEVLKNEGLAVGQFIDTVRVARHVVHDAEQYNLQYLRYFLHVTAEGAAHDALGDITVLQAVFDVLRNRVAEKFGEEGVVEKMLELTQTPVLLTSFGFGKYRGKSFEEVAASDRGYLEWLLGSESAKNPGEQNEELMFTLKHYCA